jgi:hypothetical protein
MLLTVPPKSKKETPKAKKVKTSLALPEPLWTAARIRALQDGVDAQDLVAHALELYLRRKADRS